MTFTLKVIIIIVRSLLQVVDYVAVGVHFRLNSLQLIINFVRYAHFGASARLIYDLFVKNIATSRIYDYIPI